VEICLKKRKKEDEGREEMIAVNIDGFPVFQ